MHRRPSDAQSPRPAQAGFSLVELLVTVVVMLIVLGIVTQLAVRSNTVYAQQQAHMDRRYNAATTVEMVARLVRQAQSVTTDPDGNGLLDSIGLVADWNPRDGDNNDPYETIVFTQAGTTLFKREPADAAPVAFAEGINRLTFDYFNPGGGAVLNPLVVTPSQLAFIRVTVGTPPVDGQPGMTLSSSASVRRLE
jgi:prepilin-type N-terminal cleavage/methylation domain-containing protein